MKRFQMMSCLGLSLCASIIGCEQSAPIPLPEQVDVIIAPAPDSASPALPEDMYLDLDEAVRPPEDMAIVPMDAGLPAYVVDVDPSVPPSADEYVIIGGGDRTQMIWWRGGRVFSQTFTAQVMLTEENGPPPLAPVDPSLVDIVAEPVIELGYYPPYSGGIEGMRAPSSSDGHPGFVFFPNESNGWQILDLSLEGLTLTELGLYGPLGIGARSAGASSVDQIVVIGRSSASEDASTAQVVLGEGIDSTPSIGVRNRGVPTSITTSGGDWLMGFEDGICTTLAHSDLGPSEELGSWPCGTGPGAELIGRGVMTGVATGVYGAGQTSTEFLVWDPRAGEQVHPGVLTIPSAMESEPEEEEQAPSIETDAGPTLDAGDMGMDDATADHDIGLALPDADIPDERAEFEAGAIQRIRGTNGALRWLNRVPLGRALTLANGDAYLLTENEISLLQPAQNGVPLGVIQATGGALFAIGWDSEGLPSVERIDALEMMPPPSSGSAACPGRVPESCDFDDHDCDGFGRSYLCCPFSFDFDDLPLNSTEPLEGNWLVLKGDEGPISAVTYAQQAELHNMVGAGQSCLGCWPAGSDLTHLSRAGAIMVLAGRVVGDGSDHSCPATCATAEPLPVSGSTDEDIAPVNEDMGLINVDAAAFVGDAGISDDGGQMAMEEPTMPPPSAPALFWHLAPNLVETTVAPCERIWHIESYRDAGGATVRVYCSDARYEYRVQGGILAPEVITQAYPFGNAVWFGPPVKRREGGDDVTYLLAASGPDLSLNLLRITRDADTQEDLGEENASITDRSHPFRPSISNTMRPARIIDERFVEVHIQGQGWYRAPSRRFARKAHFSAHDHYAVTVAEELDRTAPDYDSVRQALLFYLHDLQVGGNHWGKPLQVRSSTVLDHSFHGISVADYSQVENERTLWVGIGRARSPVVFSGFALKCRANSDL